MSSSEIDGTPRAFHGTQEFRGTPVENHCFRVKFFNGSNAFFEVANTGILNPFKVVKLETPLLQKWEDFHLRQSTSDSVKKYLQKLFVIICDCKSKITFKSY